jgi:two-component system, NtrC family, C4-dicarboxylate transport response regulator DctD
LKPVYEALGISRKTLYEKMQKYGLDKRMLKSAPLDDGDSSTVRDLI